MRRSVDWFEPGAGLVRCAKSVLQAVYISRLLRVSNLCEHQTTAVIDLKLMVGWGEHKVVLDESEFSACRVDVAWGLNFLSVKINSVIATFLCSEAHNRCS